jgi:hypothetical protein
MVWLVAVETATQSVTGVEGAGAIELKEPMRDCESHSVNHAIKGNDCCGRPRGRGRGARGGMNGGPTWYTRVILECGEEGVLHRPVQSSTQVRVIEGRWLVRSSTHV